MLQKCFQGVVDIQLMNAVEELAENLHATVQLQLIT